MKKIYIILGTFIYILSLAKLTFAQDASDSSSIRERVQRKVEEALNNPKTYIGSVTDIAENTIQIKPATGEIKQISVDGNIATIVNAVGKTSKEVKVTDIAIGDFIVAMGYVTTSRNANAVLDAKRILIVSPLGNPNRKSYAGTITSQTKTISTLTTLIGDKEIQFTTNTKTKIAKVVDDEVQNAKITDLGVGDKILISGVEETKGLTSRRILILEEAQ